MSSLCFHLFLDGGFKFQARGSDEHCFDSRGVYQGPQALPPGVCNRRIKNLLYFLLAVFCERNRGHAAGSDDNVGLSPRQLLYILSAMSSDSASNDLYFPSFFKSKSAVGNTQSRGVINAKAGKHLPYTNFERVLALCYFWDLEKNRISQKSH